MIFLLFSVASSTAILLLFRFFKVWNVQTFAAIVINYVVALCCGLLMVDDSYVLADQISKPWLNAGVMVGLLFISLFYLMALTSQKMGVSVTSVATKMSLIVPVAYFLMTDPNEKANGIIILAIALALIAVVLTSYRKSEGKFDPKLFIFPLVIFIGSGIIDLVLGKFSTDEYLKTDSDFYLFSCAPFFTSAIIGGAILAFQSFRGKIRVNTKTIIAGTLLGVINFGSIWFLVKTFNSGIMMKSAIIPVNNLGVVLLSTVLGIIIFREKLKSINWVGLLLGLAAIGILIANQLV